MSHKREVGQKVSHKSPVFHKMSLLIEGKASVYAGFMPRQHVLASVYAGFQRRVADVAEKFAAPATRFS